MKEELREIIESKIQIISEKKNKDGSLNILAPWIVTGRKNRNGRLYSQPLIQREVAKFQDRIKSGSVIGSADHPGGAHTTLADASHIITKLSLDKNGQGWAEMKILPTSKGKNVIEIIKAKGQLGLSARGAGTILPSGVVGDDYKLLGIDIVTNPSEPTATFDQSNVFESVNFDEEKKMKNKKMELTDEYLDGMLKDCYEMYKKDDGFKGTFADFKKHFGNAFLAEILIQEGECKTTEEAIKYLRDKGIEQRITDNKDAYLEDLEGGGETLNQGLNEMKVGARLHTYFTEACTAGFVGSYDEWVKKFPEIVALELEGKIVEKKVESKEPFKSRCSWAEIKLSGYRGTIAEYQEQFPDITIISEEVPEKIDVEKALTEKTLKQEAGRIFTALSQDSNSSLTLEDVQKMLEKEEILKADKRLRSRAIYIVNASIVGSGSVPTQEMLKEMVSDEIERLTEQRKEMREKNWAVYRKLLSE